MLPLGSGVGRIAEACGGGVDFYWKLRVENPNEADVQCYGQWICGYVVVQWLWHLTLD